MSAEQLENVLLTTQGEKGTLRVDDALKQQPTHPMPSFNVKETMVWSRIPSTLVVLGVGLLSTLGLAELKRGLDQDSIIIGLSLSGLIFNVFYMAGLIGKKVPFVSEKTHFEALAATRVALLGAEKENADTAIHLLHARNSQLEREIARFSCESESQLTDLINSHAVTIMALAALAETRDNETGNHIFRTQHYVLALAQNLRINKFYEATLVDAYIDQLFKAAPLHDIGKVGIPDRILLKPDRLDADESKIMKTHTTLGRDAIKIAQKRVGIHVPQLEIAMEIAYSHHEKWDGTGYPEGLAGMSIPLSARIMAIADVYDALISRRVYKSSMTHEQAVNIIWQNRGVHFDPDVTDAFMEITEKFNDIAMRYVDTPLDLQKKIDYMANSISELVEIDKLQVPYSPCLV